MRDSRGFLWFCTDEGLSLFDGYSFTNYGVNEGLPHPIVSDILETRAGDYWVATNGGLCKFNPKGVPSSQLADADLPRANPPQNPMFTVVMPHGEDCHTQIITTLLEGRRYLFPHVGASPNSKPRAPQPFTRAQAGQR